MANRLEGTSPRAQGINPRAVDQAVKQDPTTRFKCAGCGERHSGYHATPGPWPYCLSAACKSCCRHPLAKDDPKTFDDFDRQLLASAEAQAVRLKQAGLL